jgi:hypothetical protein
MKNYTIIFVPQIYKKIKFWKVFVSLQYKYLVLVGAAMKLTTGRRSLSKNMPVDPISASSRCRKPVRPVQDPLIE